MVNFLHIHFLAGPRYFLLLGMVFCLSAAYRPVENVYEVYDVKVVKYYPNPATAYINFEFPDEIDPSYSLSIFSFVGKKMADFPVHNNKITVPLADYYRGIYVFQLKDRSGKIIETGKFQVIK